MGILNRVTVDAANVYKLEPASRIELRRGDAKILLEEGLLAFFIPVDGRITGAVFSGRGHILAVPRDPVEKQQLAYFLGAPVLDENFANAYIRFTDDTPAELLRDLQAVKAEPQTNSTFANAWQAPALSRNPGHSLRILSESFSQSPAPYFAVEFGGTSRGPFDLVLDEARDETEMIGQAKKVNGAEYYNIWTSYHLPGVPPRPPAFRSLSYRIDTLIRPDNSISGEAHVRARADRSGERLIPFQFSNLLRIESATLAGKPLPTFPDETAPPEDRARSNDELLFVLLPEPLQAGEEVDLTLRYHGNVIRDAGNGVLFVSARESWYPHIGDTSEFSLYDLTFHWPRKFRLAATGTKVDEREEGDQRVGHWHTEKPASVAGFNLGEYAFASLASAGYSIDVYANRQLEQALLDRLRETEQIAEEPRRPFDISPNSSRMQVPMVTPSPADALKRLARGIDSSIRFYENYSGPFPARQLSVSQIPSTFGQGWPGLLYISTYAFLPTETQQRAGLSATGSEHFSDLMPFHEVAHQWWGNVVGWRSYRDQWIDEGIASYLSLLFADSQRVPEHKLHLWLDRFRKRLVEKGDSGISPSEIGSMSLGARLDSSQDPAGFEQLIYAKGAWTFHMIREMLREQGAKNPDARFVELLHTLQTKYAYRALSTDDLQHELESVMTPGMNLEGHRSMEWFFADWVRGTGIPHYRLQYSAKRTEKGFVIRGKLLQTGVPDGFVAPVPIYSASGGYLGRVIAGGPETPFHFVTAREPGKLSIDPQFTLLCVVEH